MFVSVILKGSHKHSPVFLRFSVFFLDGPASSGCFSSAFLFSLGAVAFSLGAAALTGPELSSALSLTSSLMNSA